MFFSLPRIPLTNKDTKPPATFEGRILLSLQNSSLLAWYSFNVKYDLLTFNIKGQTTFSHTILRFSVEYACLPFLLAIFLLSPFTFSFVSSTAAVVVIFSRYGNPSFLLVVFKCASPQSVM